MSTLESWKWTSIESFYNVRKMLVQYEYLTGPVKTVRYRAKIKLHGACAAIQIDSVGNLTTYSRTNQITVENDFMGFARWVDTHREQFLQQHTPQTDIIIYGEWAGKGIQKGVAVSEVERMFAVFAARQYDHITGCETFISEPSKLTQFVNNIPGCYVLPWFNNGEEFPVKWDDTAEQLTPVIDNINVHVSQVEICDPWIEATFGVKGIGEGLVFYPDAIHHDGYKMFSNLCFKAKGEKHKTIVHSKPVQAEPTPVEGLSEFVTNVVTLPRLEQGVRQTNNGSDNFMMVNLGPFLKWIAEDLQKEISSELDASGLDKKVVFAACNNYAKNWFMSNAKKL